MRAPAFLVSHGYISGIRFAQVKTIESSAIVAIHSFYIVPGPDFDSATTAFTYLKARDMSPVLPYAFVCWERPWTFPP
jgi:hypothetical protein